MIPLHFKLIANASKDYLSSILYEIIEEIDDMNVLTSSLFYVDDIEEKIYPIGSFKFNWFNKFFRSRKYNKLNAKRIIYDHYLEQFINNIEEKDDLQDAIIFYNVVTNLYYEDGDKEALGFVASFDEGSEDLFIIFVSKGDEEWRSRRGSIKTQYAYNFIEAHKTVCDIIKIFDDRGMVEYVDDEYEYYYKMDERLMIERWNEQMQYLRKVIMEIYKDDFEGIIIGGSWRMRKDGGLERV